MKPFAILLLTVLLSILSLGLLADEASNDVRIELVREDINEWAVDKGSIWLKLSEPSQARLSAKLESTTSNKRFKVYLENIELASFYWYGDEPPNVIMVPVNKAALEILEQLVEE